MDAFRNPRFPKRTLQFSQAHHQVPSLRKSCLMPFYSLVHLIVLFVIMYSYIVSLCLKHKSVSVSPTNHRGLKSLVLEIAIYTCVCMCACFHSLHGAGLLAPLSCASGPRSKHSDFIIPCFLPTFRFEYVPIIVTYEGTQKAYALVKPLDFNQGFGMWRAE